MAREEELTARLAEVRRRVERACGTAGRSADELTLVAVTKFFPADDVEALAAHGVGDIGESRDQEAGEKVGALAPATRAGLRVHFVGQLQTNKAKRVARYADVVQSVDRARLVRSLETGRAEAVAARAATGPLDVLLQVDLGEGEDAGRGGAVPGELDALAEAVAAAEHLTLRGVMAIAPPQLDEDGTFEAFRRLVEIGGRLRHIHPAATWVSAGMSGDLEAAVAAGATHLRVGSAILGSRPAQR
ncbi:YggS family pyridoxal phosphate-dependent enzyme [Serinicoccus kebangsaanensis]|uniref:YggS family pyridoxal phosphate-dependent enzyme n=1 Tax=Serinicoccus kebangsaanensis TaxID=2602069 RepID=UPI00124D8A1B|nr:YggS family pyridoxal phosphate-dependent enzyme [Serinicoccus kebangsaanensis]